MSSDGKQAFDRLWELQDTDGPGKGGWQWYEANLDPWENHESGYYGAALVALALAQAPEAYRQDPANGPPAASLNKRYPEGSMPSRFMQDAATGFAVMALLHGESGPRP